MLCAGQVDEEVAKVFLRFSWKRWSIWCGKRIFDDVIYTVVAFWVIRSCKATFDDFIFVESTNCAM